MCFGDYIFTFPKIFHLNLEKCLFLMMKIKDLFSYGSDHINLFRFAFFFILICKIKSNGLSVVSRKTNMFFFCAKCFIESCRRRKNAVIWNIKDWLWVSITIRGIFSKFFIVIRKILQIFNFQIIISFCCMISYIRFDCFLHSFLKRYQISLL